MVSILNLTARRIAKEDERDLEQARVGIEAVRGVVDLLDPEAAASRSANALSQVQMLYAQRGRRGRRRGEPGGGDRAASPRRRRRRRSGHVGPLDPPALD